MLTVGVLQSLGTKSLSRPTVSRERFGSAFSGQKFAQMRPYVTLESVHWNFVACDEHDGVGAFADAGNALGQAAKLSSI